MKNKHILAGVVSLFTVSAAGLLLVTGCGKSEGPAIQVSAVKNSFQEVTSRLDAGGNLYGYLSTEKWLDGLSAKIAGWRDFANSLPNVNGTDQENIGRVFDVVTSLVKDSGIEDVSGVGVSSIEREKGFYHGKFILHHYKGKGSGYLWSMFGKTPHALTGLDLMPATTVLGGFGDGDLPMLWSALDVEIGKSGIPGAKEALAKIPEQFAAVTGLKLDDVLGSLGGEYGLVITLDDAKKISLPIGNQPMDLPEPGVMLVIKVNNDVIFDRVDKLLADNKGVIKTDREGLKMRTMPVPIPVPITLRPSLARSGDYLIVASTDALIEEALAVKSGKKPGLKSTDEFKRLSAGMSEQGNRFSFVSQRFGQTFMKIQTQAAANAGGGAAQAEMMKKLMSLNSSQGQAYAVAANGEEGWMIESNGNQDPSKVALLVPVAVAGVAAGVALPAIAKAKAKAQAIHDSGQQ